jgi:hypothetical protein
VGVSRYHAGFDPEVIEQHASFARVLGEHEIRGSKGLDRPMRHVTQVPDWRGDD